MSAATKARIEQLKIEYGLTERQARYVDIELNDDGKTPMKTKAIMAGYGKKSVQKQGYKVLKATKIAYSLMTESQKKAEIEREYKEMEANPREFLKKKFIDHSKDPEVTANQTHALELIGKMDGVFIERIEIDPGQNLRSNVVGEILNKRFLAQPSEKIDDASDNGYCATQEKGDNSAETPNE